MQNRYIELVEESIVNRGHIIPVNSLDKKIRTSESYVSMYEFGDDINSYIKESGSIAGYDGEVSLRILWFDFDSENLDKARNEVLNFIDYISDDFGIEKHMFQVYFSGGKGFHVGLHSKIIGIDNIIDKDLPNMVKEFVKKLIKDKGFECIDLKIYNKTRIIRLPYSLHKKTNLYKILVPYEDLVKMTMNEVTLASKEIKVFNRKDIKYVKNDSLYKCFDKASVVRGDIVNNNSISHSNGSLFSIPKVGDRNNTMFKQACKLFETKVLKNGDVVDIMRYIKDKTSINEHEFRAIIKSAYSRVRDNKRKDLNIKTMDSLTMKVFDIIQESDHVPTGIQEFDVDMGGGLVPGNVYPIIGKGGTKKSLVCQEICIHNALNEGNLCVYFNMEMSILEIYRRLYKRLFGKDFIDLIKYGVLKKEDLDNVNMEIQDKLNNNFYIVDNTDLEIQDFISVIRDVEENQGKKVKLVILDSMNMMKTLGSNEVFTAFENSKKLKELAKATNVAVMNINHVTKGCPLHLRDTSLYVRGGEKILDNADAYFSVSLTVDMDNSDFNSLEDDIVYHANKVYIRLKNKRMSGNVLNKVMELQDDLSFDILDNHPSEFEIKRT